MAFRAGSPNAPADAGPPDPREAMNGAGHLPHHVALRTGYVRLSAMLRPSVPLYRLFEPRSGGWHVHVCVDGRRWGRSYAFMWD